MGSVVAFIFARGGSKGLPGKNLQVLGGRSLLERAIDAAQSSALIDRVVVSTENAEIADAARAAGAEVPFVRPPELATDDAAEWGAWQHAVRTVDPVDTFVSVPATAPLRTVHDIDRAIESFQQGEWDAVVTIAESPRNPAFDMVRMRDGLLTIVEPGTRQVHRRQDAEPVYVITPVAYVTRPSYILGSASLFDGKIGGVLVPRERAIDIDTELDLYLADCLLARISTEKSWPLT